MGKFNGEKLIRAMFHRNYKVKQLADELGVSCAAVIQWRNGHATPHPKWIARLESIFGNLRDEAQSSQADGMLSAEQDEAQDLARMPMPDRSFVTIGDAAESVLVKIIKLYRRRSEADVDAVVDELLPDLFNEGGEA